MLKFLSLFSCWLVLSGSISQTPSAAFPDTPTITEKSVGKARIGMTMARLKELYKGSTYTPVYLYKYGFDEGSNIPNAVLVASRGQKLFVYWQADKKIAGLIVLNPAYQTAKGIHVGATSGQLKAVFPTATAGPHEFIEGMELASAGFEEKSQLLYVFQKQASIRKDKDSAEPSEIVGTTAKISWILVKPNR